MVELDGDDIRISSRGKLAERDIVQVTGLYSMKQTLAVFIARTESENHVGVKSHGIYTEYLLSVKRETENNGELYPPHKSLQAIEKGRKKSLRVIYQTIEGKDVFLLEHIHSPKGNHIRGLVTDEHPKAFRILQMLTNIGA